MGCPVAYEDQKQRTRDEGPAPVAVRAADADEALLQIAALQKGRHAGPDYQMLLAAMQRGKMALIAVIQQSLPRLHS